MHAKPALIDKLETDLFSDQDTLEKVFDKDEVKMVIRYRFAFTKWLDNPTLSERDMRTDLMNNFAISEATAYRDIPIILHLVGNIKQASKEFQRYKANHMITEGYKLAMDADSMIEVKQAEVLIKAAQAMVKVNKLDKDDIMPYQWENIRPNDYEITDDVTVLGIEPPEGDIETLKQQLRRKLSGESKPIQEAEIVDEK